MKYLPSLKTAETELSLVVTGKVADRWPLLTEPARKELAISIQCSTNLIARLADSTTGNFQAAISLNLYTADLTPAEAMNAPGVALSMLRRFDEASYFKTIAMVLSRAIESLNATNTLTNNQIADLAVRIGKKFYFYKLDELLLVIQRATDGRYGRDFNRIDTSIVLDWITRYDVEERAPLVIAQSTEKPSDLDKSTAPLNDEQYEQFLERVAAGKKTVVNPEPKRLADNNRAAQTAARARYVQEKAAGIVQDYQTPKIEA